MGKTSHPRNFVGCYEVHQHVLGGGSSAEVRMGINCLNNERVAVKLVDKRTSSQLEKEGTRREIEALHHLKHPNIIKLLAEEEDENFIKLVLEYGETNLFDYLVKQGGHLNEQEARRIFTQMLSAVSFCHEHNICHRDLKLENFIIDKSGTVKLIDFSLCAEIKPNKLFLRSCGSPAYAAPEVMKGRPYDSSVDVWSLGVILYAMLCGSFPFYDSDPEKLVLKIIKQKLHFPLGIPLSPALVDLISNMLTRDRKMRISLTQVRKTKWLNFIV